MSLYSSHSIGPSAEEQQRIQEQAAQQQQQQAQMWGALERFDLGFFFLGGVRV